MVDSIVAKHLECALIEIRGSEHSVTIECNVVAGLLVHQQLQGYVRIAVDKEVQTNVGRDIIRFRLLLIICYIRGVGNNIVLLAPFDKIIRPDRPLIANIVHQYTVLLRRAFYIYYHFTAPALNATVASNISCTIEGIVAECLSIISQKIPRFYIKVIRQVGKVLMVKASGKYAGVAVMVVYYIAIEYYLIRNESHRVAT